MSQNFIIFIRNLGTVELAIVLLQLANIGVWREKTVDTALKTASMVHIASSGNGTKQYK